MHKWPLLILALAPAGIPAQVTTAFTFQGELEQAGAPATGSYDFDFRLYDQASGGTPFAGPVNAEDVFVDGGLFSSEVDFGMNVFGLTDLWLEIRVREGASTGGFTILVPRQKLNPAPLAQHALNVEPNAVGAAQIQPGTVAAELPGAPGFVIEGDTGAIPAEGAGTRMMWYPGKGAFRAGKVSSDEWDDANVGMFSVAMGASTVASGDRAMAIGNDTTASGDTSFAGGDNAHALHSATFAWNGKLDGQGITSTASQQFLIRANGVGINTDTPSHELEVAGTIASTSGFGGMVQIFNPDNQGSSMNLNWSNDVPRIRLGGTGAGSQNGMDIQKGGDVSLMRIQNSGDVIIAGTLTQNSDRRYKTDIEPIGEALETLLGIEPVRYRFKPGTGYSHDEQIGLIAQDVEDAFPELVLRDDDGDRSVAYSKLTAVLIRALQEQQEQIETQRHRIGTLRRELDYQRRAQAERTAALRDDFQRLRRR